WFPLDGELTSGVPDHKEGIYFGAELSRDDPRVRSGLPLHGPNLFPRQPPELRPLVLGLIDDLTELGQRLVAAIGIGLGLGARYFRTHLTADPVVLLRIFQYPAVDPTTGWGVAEHTDYGLLTLLHQDRTGGLQVRAVDIPLTEARGSAATGDWEWVDVEPVPGALVCNLGDMLERMTGGRYRATAHRVRVPEHDRISIPFFFDPSWDAAVAELPLDDGADLPPAVQRWDDTDLHTLSGTYGEYLVSKVAKVFPTLTDNLRSPTA
ncbi:MAG: isopenicillin N synthase family dioxygenase, partial [Microthrixaceae bacterium]